MNKTQGSGGPLPLDRDNSPPAVPPWDYSSRTMCGATIPSRRPSCWGHWPARRDRGPSATATMPHGAPQRVGCSAGSPRRDVRHRERAVSVSRAAPSGREVAAVAVSLRPLLVSARLSTTAPFPPPMRAQLEESQPSARLPVSSPLPSISPPLMFWVICAPLARPSCATRPS